MDAPERVKAERVKGRDMAYDIILSGGISGVRDYKLRFALGQVHSRVRWPGACVWNPALLPEGRAYRWYMRVCLLAIIDGTHDKTVCVRLRGWYRSLGAVAEWAVCLCLGLEIVDQWW